MPSSYKKKNWQKFQSIKIMLLYDNLVPRAREKALGTRLAVRKKQRGEIKRCFIAFRECKRFSKRALYNSLMIHGYIKYCVYVLTQAHRKNP